MMIIKVIDNNFSDCPKYSLRNVSSQINFGGLSQEKPLNRHCPERSQTQPE